MIDIDAITARPLDDAEAFDIARAVYWFAAHWYAGQTCPLYRLLCGNYQPAHNENGPDVDGCGEEIYNHLSALILHDQPRALRTAERLARYVGLIETPEHERPDLYA